jgi:Na+/proline symporter
MATILFFTPFALYLGAVVLVTLTTRSKSDDSDYFFASKRLGTLQALLSVISSETSVATTVVFPAAGFASGYALIWLLFGYIAGRSIVAVFYLRALYESQHLTIYQTISSNHRLLEGAYLLAKYISGGVRFFIGALALHTLLIGPPAFWGIFVCILIIGGCVAAYSLTGGLRAVVIMDQIQSALLVCTGIFLCLYLFARAPAGALELPAFVDWDPSHSTFFPIAFLGGAVLSIGSHGADQDMLLRVLSTTSFAQARRSLILSGFCAAALIGVYLTAGYLLRYAGIAGLDAKQPLVDFVGKADVPLLKGVFLVLLTAAAMSSLDSTIHSTGAIWKSLMNSRLAGRYWSAFSLLIMVVFATVFIELNKNQPDLLALCMGSMNYVNGGLIGIITVFTFFRRWLSGSGVALALIAGCTTTAICEFTFTTPVPWTYTVLFSSSAALVACLCGGFLTTRQERLT